ncbi:hypothetical protein [Burkholderia sp. S171]|uniref:hypothetical protein n=1 Tax=Burkholderia sp. S171 TaxID=1641860 RepID=UPI00131DF2F8|nr:hypothetical protein [Burkholderia sp. S171]
MSAIDNYWHAVQRRVNERAEHLDSDGERNNRSLEPAARPGGGDSNPQETEGLSTPLFGSPAHFYCYKSIRFSGAPGEWGVYVMTAGRDHVAKLFGPYCSSEEDAEQTANDFLMACGTAHYRFDVFAMSLEAIQRRLLYVPYRKASVGVNAPALEAAFVHQAALEWAATHGLAAPVTGILGLWTTNTVLHHIPKRALGAYMATALAEGFGALLGPARYDQAEWVNTIPEALRDECPGPRVLSRPLTADHNGEAQSTNPTPENWLARWGIRNYTKFKGGEYRLGESLVIFGDVFPDGQFPFHITEIDGDFVCQETNLSTVVQLPTSVSGNADISRNRHLHDFGGIHKHLKSVRGGVLRVSEELVDSAVLGLLEIKGLRHIEATRDAGKPPVKSWAQIVSDFLPVPDAGTSGIRGSCQCELVLAGLKGHGRI